METPLGKPEGVFHDSIPGENGVGLRFRAESFNIFNNPNFGSPINYLSSPQFGQATQMLNNYLGSGGQSGGLNPLYQIGGPRSIQLALKLHWSVSPRKMTVNSRQATAGFTVGKEARQEWNHQLCSSSGDYSR